MSRNPKLVEVNTPEPVEPAPKTDATGDVAPIVKPGGFNLEKFRSKRDAAIANVETLLTALPHYPISQAKDFVRLHPSEETHWSFELCFVNVPIKGQKRDTLHLMDEELAVQYLPSGRIIRFRFALATKPFDVFFLAHVPTRNLDNSWNASAVQASENAKTLWTQATSRKEQGVESYKIDFAAHQDAFPEPKWPTQSLWDLIGVTFANRSIETADHPALLRLIGARQSLA
jgi:hypothetical protein